MNFFKNKNEKTDKIDTVFIHIGKCGGSSVIEELNKKNIQFIEKHVDKVKFRKKKKYYIVIRNPISRFISAFNWRYKLVVEDGEQKDRFPGEREFLETFKNVNDLAENIYNEKGELVLNFRDDEFYVHHLKEDIDFYLGDLLKRCKKKHIIGVLATETLRDDIKRYFDIELTSHLKKNKKTNSLSSLALNNLITYLEKDFECIERLNEMNVLTDIQYKKLSNKSF